jgi:GNAT superfamily N-acetyltransferase
MIGNSSYVRVSVGGKLAGNAFACRWTVNGKNICWVTQLVVHREYRKRGLATGLLNEIRLDADDVYGVMSSHPAACLAAAKAFASEYMRLPTLILAC